MSIADRGRTHSRNLNFITKHLPESNTAKLVRFYTGLGPKIEILDGYAGYSPKRILGCSHIPGKSFFIPKSCVIRFSCHDYPLTSLCAFRSVMSLKTPESSFRFCKKLSREVS